MKPAIRITLAAIMVLFLAGTASAQSYRFAAGFTFYDNETSVEVNSLELVNSRQVTPMNEELGNYRFVLKSGNGEIIAEGKRTVSFRMVGPPVPNGTSGVNIGVDSREMTIYFNYSKEASVLEVYENGEKQREVDLVNRICSATTSECSDYCVYHDSAPDSCEIEDESSEQENQTEQGISSEIKTVFIGIVFAILASLAIIYYRRRSVSENG